jgi:hypothetical protein
MLDVPFDFPLISDFDFRAHRGIPQESLPLDLGFFEFVHDVRARGKRLLDALIGQLLAPPRNPS